MRTIGALVRFSKWSCSLLLGACFLLPSGCVTREIIEDDPSAISTTLLVSQCGDVATLQWNSDKKIMYTVLYTSERGAGATWQKLPGHSNIRGTGEKITITDRIPYSQEYRGYRLEVEPIDAATKSKYISPLKISH